MLPTVKLHDHVPRVEYALVALAVENDLHGQTPDSNGVGGHLGPAGVRGELERDGGPVAYCAGYAELTVNDNVPDVLLGGVEVGEKKDLAGVVRAREDEDPVTAGSARERGPVQEQGFRVFFAVQFSTVWNCERMNNSINFNSKTNYRVILSETCRPKILHARQAWKFYSVVSFSSKIKTKKDSKRSRKQLFLDFFPIFHRTRRQNTNYVYVFLNFYDSSKMSLILLRVYTFRFDSMIKQISSTLIENC